MAKLSNLINLSEEIKNKSIKESNSLKFMSRLLVMVNLPYRSPGEETTNWTRINGKVRINISGGYEGEEYLGIPYGCYPRLILAYLITEAVKTQSRKIYLGKSFHDFVKTLELKKGGKTFSLLHEQMKKLFCASFAWTDDYDQYHYRYNFHLAPKYKLWWPPQLIDKEKMFDSYVVLNQEFYDEILTSPIPLDFRVIRELKNKPMVLDMYMFLSWRTYNLQKPVYISWENLKHQIGHQYKRIGNFSADCIEAIAIVKTLYPSMNVDVMHGRIYLGKSDYLTH